MKKRISMVLAACLLVSGLSACGVKSGAGSANSNEIKIGINYELSGNVASYGQSSVDGIMMAIDEINAAGGVDGKTIVPVKYDNKSEPQEAITLANKLISQDKVLAILGPATSGSFKSEISVAEKKKIPVISGSATADDVTVDKSGKKAYAFRICYTDSFQGTAMANFAAQNLNAKKAVIVKDSSSDYAKGLAENFIKTFTAAGGTIVGEEAYIAKDKDFNAILTKIKGLDFDVIYLPGYYEEAGLIIKQARALGIDKPILGADGFDSPDLAKLAGNTALTKVYFTNHYSSLDKDPTVTKFIDDFKKKYSRDPDAFNALGYDLAKFLVDGIKRSQSLDSAALKDALEGTKDFTGVTGSFSIDENHNPVKAIVVIGLENGVQTTAVRSGK